MKNRRQRRQGSDPCLRFLPEFTFSDKGDRGLTPVSFDPCLLPHLFHISFCAVLSISLMRFS